MGVISGGGATVAQIWDELIANARVAGSLGQRLKDAVALDTFTAARITDITKISSAAIAAGDTANSIAQKLRGATDNQAFPSAAGMVISSFDNSLFTMTASQTIDIIPATGESDFGEIILNATGGGVGYSYLISADTGTTYIAVMTANGVTPNDAVNQYNEVLGIGNSTGRYRLTTNATAGTRTMTRVITTFK